MFKLNCHASKLPSKCLCWYPLTKAALTPNQRSLDLQWRELNTEIHGICRCREWAASVDQPQTKHVCPQLTFRKHCGRVGWRGGSWVKGYGMSFSRLGFLVWAFVLNSRQHGQWLTFLLTFSVYCGRHSGNTLTTTTVIPGRSSMQGEDLWSQANLFVSGRVSYQPLRVTNIVN